MNTKCLKKIYVFGILFFIIFLNSVYTEGENKEKKAEIEYSTLEYKALRYEMIEKDIYIRTIASMISLNRADRLKEWVEKLTKTATSESPYYKNSIASVYRKWKKISAYDFEEKVEKEAASLLKTIEKTEASGQPADWSEIYRYYNTILENCRACHETLGVIKP